MVKGIRRDFRRRMFPSILSESRERRRLFWMLKKLDSKLYKSVKKIDRSQQKGTLKYLIVSKLKEMFLDLEMVFSEKKSKSIESHSGDHYIEHKISKIPAKIKLFELDFDKEEFKKIYYFLKTLYKEVENV